MGNPQESQPRRLLPLYERRASSWALHCVAGAGSRGLFSRTVLFFVSVAMLSGPRSRLKGPPTLATTVAIIVRAYSPANCGIARAFRHDRETALTIAASLAQIGEFLFILVVLRTSLGILPDEG